MATKPWLPRSFAIVVFLSLPILSLPSAFQSDELLLEDEEFEGSISSDLLYRSQSSPATGQRTDLGPTTSSDSKSVQFSLEHSFGGSDFVPAGTFTARLKSSNHGGQTLTKLRFSRNTLTSTEKEAFERLLRDDDFYTIRVPSNVLHPVAKDYVISSIRARCIPRETLDEQFIIHMEGASIVAVNYGSAGACQYPRLMKLPAKWSFNSYTVLKNGEKAPRTPTFAEELIAGENAEGEGVKPPERSFWAKYWMYLIPLGLVVMNAISQAMQMPPEEQPAGQGPLQQAARPTAAVAARRR